MQLVFHRREKPWLGHDGNRFDLFVTLLMLSPLLFFTSVLVTWRSRHAIDQLSCTSAEIEELSCQSFSYWDVLAFNFFWWTVFFVLGLHWTRLETVIRDKVFVGGRRWGAKAWVLLFTFITIMLGLGALQAYKYSMEECLDWYIVQATIMVLFFALGSLLYMKKEKINI